MGQFWIDGRATTSATESLFDEREVEQGVGGAWWLFVSTACAWLGISLLVFEVVV
jgi:hypothetical protein